MSAGGLEAFSTGPILLPPDQIYEEYRHRFAIESSYRLMNQVRARTTSASVALRLFFVALAFLLLNLWNLVKASAYALPPFATWRCTIRSRAARRSTSTTRSAGPSTRCCCARCRSRTAIS